MLHIIDTVGIYDIEILIDDEWKDCLLMLRYREPFNFTKVDEAFPNARMLSTVLSDALGLGPARDLMFKHNVPRQSQMWFMNHSYHPEDPLNN